MAKSLVGGALGGEEGKPEIEAPEALAGAEAFAAAVAAKPSGNDPGVARKTEGFLEMHRCHAGFPLGWLSSAKCDAMLRFT